MLRRIIGAGMVTVLGTMIGTTTPASWAQSTGTAGPASPTVLGKPPAVPPGSAPITPAVPSTPATPAPPISEPATTPEPEPVTVPEPVVIAPEPVIATPPATDVVDLTVAPLPIAEREFSAELGLSAGGRSTVGGARITGRFLYQLASQDWFEGSAIFNFGSSSAACFRDRNDARICEHGAVDGSAVELSFGVRRYFDQGSAYLPFARAAIGLGIARFADDDITGLIVPLHAGGGLRVVVAPRFAIVGLAELTLGFGKFGGNLGIEPQLGFGISAGVEFSTR